MRPIRARVLIALVAVIVRWAFCFWLFPVFLAGRSTVGKRYYFDSYREIASSLVSGGGYRLGSSGPPALHRPPGYVLFLALCRPSDVDRCSVWVHLLHGVLGACAALLTIGAARAWGVGSRGALFAGWVVALWPFAIWETKVTVPENLLLALVPAGFLSLARIERGLRWAALAGLLGAAMALTHPTYQVIVLPFAAAVAVSRELRPARKVAGLALLLLAFGTPVGLWVLRNHRLGYDGIATGFGSNYFRGVYAFEQLRQGAPYYRDHDVVAAAFIDGMLRSAGLPSVHSDSARSDPLINRYLDRLAFEHMKTHSSETALKVAVETPLAWVQQQTPLRSAATALLLAPLFGLAVRGVRRDRSLGLLAFALLVVNAAFALVAVEAIPMRYMLPLMPLVAILAGSGLPSSARHESTESPAVVN